jgi:hypothetical protein
MFLRRLRLNNVRSLETLDLAFLKPDGTIRQWTLLLGENGCGKSTVLRACALLLAGSEALPELLGEPDSWIRLGQSEALLHADLVTAKGEPRQVEIKLQRGDKLKDVYERNKQTLDELDRALEHTPRNYLTIGYGVSRRLSADQSLNAGKTGAQRHPRARSVATMFSNDAVLNPLESWAMDLHYRRGAAGLRIIKLALEKLLPGVGFAGIDKEQRQLLFDTPDGTLPLAQLSDGYQNVAAWCGDLLYRITEIFADYKNPLTARGLLLVDELDLHLHPLWQRQLIAYLSEKLPNFQIVGTTHSVLTAQQAGAGELCVLRRPAPDSAPLLEQFMGEPRRMMLHQLLVSPIFGLTTVDSTQVETMRHEFNQLRAKPVAAMSAEEKQRLPELRDEIKSLPDWSAATPLERKQSALLDKIEQALETSPASATSLRAGQRHKRAK